MILLKSSDLIKDTWKYVSTNTCSNANLIARAPFRHICVAIPASPTGALSLALSFAYSITEALTRPVLPQRHEVKQFNLRLKC